MAASCDVLPAQPPSQPRRLRFLLVLCVSWLVVTGVVWETSQAAFTTSTLNPGSSVATGNVTLTNNAPAGVALVNATNLKPGQSGRECIRVDYGGSLPAAVALRAASGGGALASSIELAILEGTGGGYGDCAGFVPRSLVYGGTVSSFLTDVASPANAAGFFAPTGPGESRSYQLWWRLSAGAANNTQGGSANLSLLWEATQVATASPFGTGRNAQAQLGLADTTVRRVATTAPSGAGEAWTALAGNDAHSCGIRRPGTLWCWGSGADGRLGLGAGTGVRNTPQQVGTATDWTQVSTGWAHTCGLKGAGELHCWGSDDSGEGGDGNFTSRNTPARVGTAQWRQVSAGDYVTCGIQVSGVLWCWGVGNQNGQELGTGDVGVPTPVGAFPVSTWDSVAVGDDHTCATRSDRTLWCWGANNVGQLGIGSTTNQGPPVQVAGDWALVAPGYNHTCAITIAAQLFCWGNDVEGQLGVAGTVNRTTPTRVGTASTWSAVSPGNNSTCALSRARVISCTGYNALGQLGLNDTTNRVDLTVMPGPTASAMALGATRDHQLFLAWPS